MSTARPSETVNPARRSRTTLVTFLGSVVRPMGDWMPIAGTIELMGQLGLEAPAVRTAVFRLKKRGWLVSQPRSGTRGYALTRDALDALAAGDEVIWHSRQAADLDDGWCVLTFSIPEASRSKRDQLRAHLSALGFGNVSGATWIAPARMSRAADQAVYELGLTANCAMFTGDYVGGQRLDDLVRRSWDLEQIDQRYRTFIAQFEGMEAELKAENPIDPGDAFARYVDLVDHWRRLPFRDPGLPRMLLPADWAAAEAVSTFERLVALLEATALGHATSFWPERAPSSA